MGRVWMNGLLPASYTIHSKYYFYVFLQISKGLSVLIRILVIPTSTMEREEIGCKTLKWQDGVKIEMMNNME